MATQTQRAAYRSLTTGTDRLPGACIFPAKTRTKPWRHAKQSNRLLLVQFEGGRHVFASAIDASSLRRMALASDAVGWGHLVTDRHRSFGHDRPLRRAKAEGRFCGERREHPQFGAWWRVRSGGRLSTRCGQRPSAE